MSTFQKLALFTVATFAGIAGFAATAGAATLAPTRGNVAAAAAVHPQIHVIRQVTETVTSRAPAGAPEASGAVTVPAGTTPQISCGQYLTYYLYAAYEMAGTNDVLTSLSSVDYTKWCSGKVYTQSYRIYCNNFMAGILNFTCVNHSSGVIGQGSSKVNPWYNQSVILSILEPDGWDVTPGESYCRNYMTSTGGYSDWCTINWS